MLMENHHYNRRRENYESTDFETYYKRLVPGGQTDRAWGALLYLPRRRRALDSTILEKNPEWTDEEKQAVVDFVMLQDQLQLEDDNCADSEGDKRLLAGLIEYSVIPSLDQVMGLMPSRRKTGWFEELERIDMAKAAKRRTMEITSWDDNDKSLGPNETDMETLNYDLDRWKGFIHNGAFPKEKTG